MKEQTILIHRGGFGHQHRLGEITVTPEGLVHGYERFWVRLSILGDSHRADCSCILEGLPEVIARYTAIAQGKMTYVERCEASRRARKAARR